MISSQILLIISASMVATSSAIRARSSSKLAARGGTKRIPTQKSPEALNQVTVVAKRPPCNWARNISEQLCTCGMLPGDVNENLKTRCNFWKLPDQVVTSSSRVIQQIFVWLSLERPVVSVSLIIPRWVHTTQMKMQHADRRTLRPDIKVKISQFTYTFYFKA
jgi:hypothetical protein